jgi:hypothetical protein
MAEVLALEVGILGKQLHHLAAELLALDFEKRLMNEIRMIAVHTVFPLELPVAVVPNRASTAPSDDKSMNRSM